MDLNLFVLGGGQLSETTPISTESTNKLIFSCHECTSTENPWREREEKG
jgi:hypothetical protein